MKREINPGVVAAVLVCVLALVGFFLWKANTDKPDYPGANAPHPSAEKPMSSTEAAHHGFSGATPGSQPPPDFKGVK